MKRRAETDLLVLKKLTKNEDEVQNCQIQDIARIFSDKPSSFVILLLDAFSLQVKYFRVKLLSALVFTNHV